MIRPFRGLHPQIHDTAYVDPSAQVIGDVHLGEEASIWCNCTVRGDIHFIRIGARANVQDNSVIHVRKGTHPTILEEEVTVGHSVTLHGCYVERGSLIGIGAILLDDVRMRWNFLEKSYFFWNFYPIARNGLCHGCFDNFHSHWPTC